MLTKFGLSIKWGEGLDIPKILVRFVASEQIWVNMPYPKSSANLNFT